MVRISPRFLIFTMRFTRAPLSPLPLPTLLLLLVLLLPALPLSAPSKLLLPTLPLSTPSPSPPPPPSPPLPAAHPVGSGFVDDAGREVRLRGVNIVYKDKPYYPASAAFHSNLSFVQDDVDLLASFGVNVIRLGVMWPGVTPDPIGLDADYLHRIRAIIRMAADSGIYTLVDPHQDEFHPLFCGEGVPDFFVEALASGPAVTDFPVPVTKIPFGTSPPSRSQCGKHSSFSYVGGVAIGRSREQGAVLIDTGAGGQGPKGNSSSSFLWQWPFPWPGYWQCKDATHLTSAVQVIPRPDYLS